MPVEAVSEMPGAFWMPDTDAVLTAVFAVSALGYTPYKS